MLPAKLRATERERLKRLSETIEILNAKSSDVSFLLRLTRAANHLFPDTICCADEVNLATGAHRSAASELWPDYDSVRSRIAHLLPIEHPVLLHITGGGAPGPLMVDDFLSRKKWHGTHLYNECLRLARLEYQLVVPMHANGYAMGIAINGFLPFDEDDRFMAGLLRDHALIAQTEELLKHAGSGSSQNVELMALWRKLWKLTRREAEVLFWVAGGKRDTEIASILGTSSRTVNHQVSRILEKLSVETRSAATRVALRVAE